MKRNFAWAMLLAGGVLFGCLWGAHQQTTVGAQLAADAEEQQNEVVSELKEIKAQLKELNTMFRSGTARVVVVINPDKQ